MSPDPAAKGTLAGRRILVVEDEFFLADDMARALAELGAVVVGPVADVEEALGLLGASEVGGAVLDINLRGERVYPLAIALAERKIPFVFATGYDEAVIPPDFASVPRWEKPFDPPALAKAFADLLTRGQLASL